jgi:hypothetical protein
MRFFSYSGFLKFSLKVLKTAEYFYTMRQPPRPGDKVCCIKSYLYSGPPLLEKRRGNFDFLTLCGFLPAAGRSVPL